MQRALNENCIVLQFQLQFYCKWQKKWWHLQYNPSLQYRYFVSSSRMDGSLNLSPTDAFLQYMSAVTNQNGYTEKINKLGKVKAADYWVTHTRSQLKMGPSVIFGEFEV